MHHNCKQAVEWYGHAANQGDANVQWRLGQLLKGGDGVACNYIQATNWYGHTVEQNHPNMLCSLGLLYKRRRGIECDLEQAMELYCCTANVSIIDPAAAKLGWKYLENLLSSQQ